MAARINRPLHDVQTRLKIKTSQLVNRLQAFALGEPGVEMSRSQVAAAIALLKKTLPDLQAIEVSGDANNPLRVAGRIELVPIEPRPRQE